MTSPIKGYLISRDGRELFLRELADWAVEDPEYKVTALIAKPVAAGYEQFIVEELNEKAPSLPSTDDTAERIELMNELFSLQDLEISQLKAQLEKFVEVVEGIVEITEVVSQNNIENRSKLIVIGDSCKAILRPSE